jgi:hypothetical protein
MQEKTNLDRKYAFWYRITEDALTGQGTKLLNQDEYEHQVKKIAEFDTVIFYIKFRLKTFGLFFNI